MDYLFSKPEIKLAHLNGIMMKSKRFQTKSDWEIEKANGVARRRAYAIGIASIWPAWLFFLPTAHLRRMLGPPDMMVFPGWRMAKDGLYAAITANDGWRPQAYSYMRQFYVIFLPWLAFATAMHFAEVNRWNAYLAQPTTFGDCARAIDAGTMCSEDIIAPLDAAGKKVFGSDSAAVNFY